MHNLLRACSFWFLALLAVLALTHGRAQAQGASAQKPLTLELPRLAQGSEFKLHGIRNRQDLEFTLRNDQLATQASLNLVFTPSPALLPKLSHLRVYLNDELMGVVPVDEAAAGRQQRHTLALDPQFLTTFNRVSLEFIGHYSDVCEDLAHSSLWLDVSRQTSIVINQESLPLANDLAYFPQPFYDKNDMAAQELPVVFAGAPSMARLKAASVLASYFGSQARWKSLSFPVSYGALPAGNAVVFAINGERPDFLQSYPDVTGPTVEMISAPDNPYQKLLLVLGRNDEDLANAVTALALGGPLFRGQSVQIDEVTTLAPRKPYDAPNWMPTNRPVLLSELKEYVGQFEVQGLRPRPITINLSLPPDLFVWRNNGIPLDVRYRYTAPSSDDESRLTLSLNGRYVESYPLLPDASRHGLARIRLPVLSNDPSLDSERLVIPALKIGTHNQIRFDFSYASTQGASQAGGVCKTMLPADTRAAIDGSSLIDFSGYEHYLEMPNLGAFASSGFPFSRMADLSETVVVMPSSPTPAQSSTLFEAIAHISAQVGYPAYKMRVTDNWDEAQEADADVLWVGATPEGFRQRPDSNLLLADTTSQLRMPRRSAGRGEVPPRTEYLSRSDGDPVSRIAVRSSGPIAAVVGMQSGKFPQRSMVGLMAVTDEDYALLREAMADPGKRDAMQGTVAIIRESGVAGETVGPRYFVGQLSWWQLVWFHLSDKPILLSGIAVLTVLLIAFLIWKSLRWVARRRLTKDA